MRLCDTIAISIIHDIEAAMRFVKRHYPLIISSIMALLYLLLLIVSNSSSDKTVSVDYSMLLNSDATFIRYFLAAILTIVIGLVLLVVIMSRFARLLRSKRKVNQSVFKQFFGDLLALILTLGLLAFSGLTFMVFLWFGDGNWYTHRDSILVNNTVYNLAYHNEYDDLGYGSYVLFACDAEGRICQGVLSEYAGSDYDNNGTLSFDATTNTVSIMHHGEPIATYQISTGN